MPTPPIGSVGYPDRDAPCRVGGHVVDAGQTYDDHDYEYFESHSKSFLWVGVNCQKGIVTKGPESDRISDL